jgi:uncharacterized protein YgiB involved in biofilm formation
MDEKTEENVTDVRNVANDCCRALKDQAAALCTTAEDYARREHERNANRRRDWNDCGSAIGKTMKCNARATSGD